MRTFGAALLATSLGAAPLVAAPNRPIAARMTSLASAQQLPEPQTASAPAERNHPSGTTRDEPQSPETRDGPVAAKKTRARRAHLVGTTAPAIALTFDDLPAHGPLPVGSSRLVVADTIIAALARHHAPAFGFVNGGFGAGDPNSPVILAHWRAAGLPLGNHTFSHLSLNETSLAVFEAQVEKNEGVVAPLMTGQDWHWFRYPFLAEGDTPAKRDAVRTGLAARGYKAAAVTMSFGDYAWNGPYSRCADKRDARSVAELERSFLESARTEALRETALSRAALARDVPLVLLLHLGAFDARMIDRLLDQYEAMGYRFVSLAEAEADPFYERAVNLTMPGETPTLEAQARELGLPVTSPTATLPGDDVCG